VLEAKVKIRLLDVLILGLAAAGVAYLARRVVVGLDYRWQWEVIPQYLLRYDPQAGHLVPNLLLQGLFTTIRLSLWATLLATLLGTLMGLARLSGRLFRRMVGRSYVECVRNLPPLVLVFLFYFFLSQQVLPWLGLDQWLRGASPEMRWWVGALLAPPGSLGAFVSALATLAVYEGAYIAEIVRAGVQSVERGQWEAARALGLTPRQQLRHVIMPQAVQRILPPLAGQFISTIKDSAIVSVISIPELTFQGMELMSATYLTFEVWITITAMYLLLTLGCSLSLSRLESHLRRRWRN